MNAIARPAAFLSYDRLDDRYGHISKFKERLADEVCIQTGTEFTIFQDRDDILWGENWRSRVEDSLDDVAFFIPIITPSFFKSEYCRAELEQFLKREEGLNRTDLILPVYYVSTPLLDDAARRSEDALAQAISECQYADWRELRFEPFDSPRVGKELERLAAQIRYAMDVYESSGSRAETSPALAGMTSNEKPHNQEKSYNQEKPYNQPKAEPKTLVVDQMHRGDHTTISEAIMDASPGDRIRVMPGLYEESLVIDKPLEIIGDGDPQDIVIRAADKSALLFRTTMGRVFNLTLQQLVAKKCCCVDISQGRLELEGCDISSQSLGCIGIHGGADPRLRRNRIHEGKAEGISFYDDGLGILEENDISSNAGPGVIIIDGGPTLRRNRINNNSGEAIRVLEKGRGTIEENDLRENLKGPWSIQKDSEINLKRSGNLE